MYRKYSSDPDLEKAEESARGNKAGLWREKNPIPPWEFRHPGMAKSDDTSDDDASNDSAPKYWLNSKSGVRHNQNCKYFKSGAGHFCSDHAGKPCKICGG